MEGIFLKIIPRILHSYHINAISLVPIGQKLKALYLEYKLPFWLNIDFYWKAFPVHAFLGPSVQTVQWESSFAISQKSREHYFKSRVPSRLYLGYHPPRIPYTRCKFCDRSIIKGTWNT